VFLAVHGVIGCRITFYILSALRSPLLSLSPENGVLSSYFFLTEKSLLVLTDTWLLNAVFGNGKFLENSLIMPRVEGLGLVLLN
jgi:hypothetical protein